jgi:hypothetical protein
MLATLAKKEQGLTPESVQHPPAGTIAPTGQVNELPLSRITSLKLRKAITHWQRCKQQADKTASRDTQLTHCYASPNSMDRFPAPQASIPCGPYDTWSRRHLFVDMSRSVDQAAELLTWPSPLVHLPMAKGIRKHNISLPAHAFLDGLLRSPSNHRNSIQILQLQPFHPGPSTFLTKRDSIARLSARWCN